MVHAHPEDERLASRAMAPDEWMLTLPASARTRPASFHRTPRRLLRRRGVGIRGMVRRLETVDDAKSIVVTALTGREIVVRRVGVAKLRLSSGGRQTPRREHRRLRRRPIFEQPVDVPLD